MANLENYKMYQEYQRLIAQYDWAVEGFPAPEGTEVTKEKAVEIRNSLVKLAGEVQL